MPIQNSNSGKRRIILPYNKALRELARKLRKNMTQSEKLLWNELKGNKIFGFDFDRQRPIDNYIVDFYCKDLMLAIEIDGIVHDNEEAKENDKERQEKLESLGVRFLRFKEEDLIKDLDNVVETISNWIESNAGDQPGIKTHPPTPSKEGEIRLYQMKKTFLKQICFTKTTSTLTKEDPPPRSGT